ncbi:hypothetical protein AMTRI_Chr11g97520 [Amborella trichopoda]
MFAQVSGALGIRNLRLHNNALLSKGWWRYVTQPSNVLREVIKYKYCHGSNQRIPVCRTSGQTSGFWKSILRCHENFFRNILLRPREGTLVLFGHDIWVGIRHLRDQFPNLFQIACEAQSTIADNFVLSGYLRSWSPNFRRPLNDYKLDEFGALGDLLHSVHTSF